jgi:hypothetical protein
MSKIEMKTTLGQAQNKQASKLESKEWGWLVMWFKW